MHIFQSALQFAFLLLPALLASASPHSLERRMPGLVDELKLFEYPSTNSNANRTPFVTLELGSKRVAEGSDLASYDVEWKRERDGVEIPAIAMMIEEEQYDRVKRILTRAGTFLGSGQDAENKVWIIVSRSEEPDQPLESSDSESITDSDDEDDEGVEYY